LRCAAYGDKPLPDVNSLDDLIKELETINTFRLVSPQDTSLFSKSSKKPIFEPDDIALLDFLFPKTGIGPVFIRPYRKYHDANASDFTTDILKYLDEGKTVILDLGNAEDLIRQYFSDMLSSAVFSHQEEKFTTNTLNRHFIQLYFEEAHNLFPASSNDTSDIYSRFAKEGAKFHIGMIYSTQSPSTISKELLAQTENFFVGHLSSQDEARALARLQVAFDGIEQDILRAKTPGFMRMLTMSNRFVVPVQAKLYDGI
jgi:DNA helicase HerA-like ATPase